MTDYDKMEAMRKKKGIEKIMANAGSALDMAAQANNNNTTFDSIGSSSQSFGEEIDKSGELRKIILAQKRDSEAKASIANFYDLKKGNLNRRGTIKDELKSALSEQMRRVFENKSKESLDVASNTQSFPYL